MPKPPRRRPDPPRPAFARVRLEGLTFRGRHGVLPEERRLGGSFRVDLTLVIPAPARFRDRLEETVDYRTAFAAARRVLEGPPRRTLEFLADAVALALARLPRVVTATVRVTKLAPPLTPGAVSSVEISRSA